MSKKKDFLKRKAKVYSGLIHLIKESWSLILEKSQISNF